MDTDNFDFCPHCAGEGTVARVDAMDDVEIRGETFNVPIYYFACSRCNESFQPDDGDVGLPRAVVLYRAKHGMISPAEMLAFRKNLGLSQAEFALIMGWGTATVSRYENDRLQEAAHDKELRLAMRSPENVLELVSRAEGLSQDTRERLTKRLQKEVADCAIESAFVQCADVLQGVTLNIKKLTNLVVMLCGNSGVYLTKLNKLLFYTDFKARKDLGHSVSNLCYVRLPYGPVPSRYSLLYNMLEQHGAVKFEEVSGPVEGTRIVPLAEPDRNCFDDDELAVILGIRRRFERTSASEISNISHKEVAWTNTPTGALISYEHATSLSI